MRRLLALVPLALAPVAAAQVAPGTIRYTTTVSVQGMDVPMTTTHTVAAEGAGWRVVSVTRLPDFIGGGAVEDTVSFGADLFPTARHMRARTPMAQQWAALAFSPARVTGQYGENGGVRTVDVATDAPAHTSATLDFYLGALPLAEGYTTTVKVFDVEEGAAVVEAVVAVVGRESVTVPAGTFDAWKTTVRRGEATSTLWIEAAAPRRVVKLTAPLGDGDGTVTQVLEASGS